MFGCCVYVFDKDGNCLRKFGEEENLGQFSCPTGVSYVNNNESLIENQGNHRIGQLNIQTGTAVEIMAQEKGEFDNPADVCLDDEGRIV